MRYAELAENEPCKNGADDSAKSAEKTVVLRWLGLLGGHDEDGLRGDVRVVVFGHSGPPCWVNGDLK